VLLVLVVISLALSRVDAPGSKRGERLEQLCKRGARLHEAKLLDEAAVVYARAAREKAECADELDKVTKDQEERSDAIENARVERLVATRLPKVDAAQHRDDAYDAYLEAFAKDVRSPGARRGLRALLRAQARALGDAFEDRSCERAGQLVQSGLLYEARQLSGIVLGSCPDQRKDLLDARRDAALAVSRGDGYAAAGSHSAAFEQYVRALERDPSSERAIDGLSRLPTLVIPKRKTAADAAVGGIDSAALVAGAVLGGAVLVVVVLLFLAMPALAVLRRRADRRRASGSGRDSSLLRDAGLSAAVEERFQVTATQGALDAGEREAVELITEAMRTPELIRGRPADEVIEANPRFLDTLPAEVVAAAMPRALQIIAAAPGGEAVSRAWNAAAGVLVRPATELPIRFVRGPEMRMEMDLPASLGGAMAEASVADLSGAVPSDPRQVRHAVARMLVADAFDKIRSGVTSA
jgi:tetratricopeptide (TPR) repeat protein